MEKETSFSIVKTFCNNTLKNLLTEMDIISRSDKPSQVKQSFSMKRLFKAEKTEYNYWSDQYSTVKRVIEIEVVRRFKENLLN